MRDSKVIISCGLNPLLSVLLPVRPYSLLLKQAVVSINCQTFTNWELVVLLDRDEGSSKRLISEIVTNNSVKFLDVDVSRDGFAGVLNRGVDLCCGDFIARCDDDDINLVTRFDQQVKILEYDPKSVAVTGYANVVDSNGVLIREMCQPQNEQELVRALCNENIFPHSATAFRKDTFNKCGGYKLGIDGCADYELWMRMALYGQLKLTCSPLISYLDNPEGMSRWIVTMKQLKVLNKTRGKLLRSLNVPFIYRVSINLKFVLRQKIGQLKHGLSLRVNPRKSFLESFKKRCIRLPT